MTQPSATGHGNKCSRCRGSTCCTYITQALGILRAKADFDHLLWQVAHDGVEAYRDSDGWYLLIRGRCEHLAADGHCRIYANRPQICREYSDDWCEFDEPAEAHFREHFRTHAELQDYCRQRFRTWGD